MAARDEQVLPAIVVEIKCSVAPPRPWKRQLPEPARISDIRKLTAADISEQRKRLIGKRGNKHIFQSVVVNIPKIHAHCGNRLAVCIQCDTSLQRGFAKLSVTFVV